MKWAPRGLLIGLLSLWFFQIYLLIQLDGYIMLEKVYSLNDSDALDSIFDDITEKYSYKPRINTWNRNKNEFILFINNLNSQSTSPISNFGHYCK